LLRRKKEIAVSANSEILAVLLLKAAIDAALTREGIEIVNVELALSEGAPEVGAWSVSQRPPMVEVELIQRLVSWMRSLARVVS
jgi:hypothetical protein